MYHHFSNVAKAVSLVLIVALCNMMWGCTFYSLNKHPSADLEKAKTRYILVHHADKLIVLKDIQLTTTDLIGTVRYKVVATETPDNSIHDPTQALEAHIYLDSLEIPEVAQGDELKIPLSSIRSLMLYDVNIGATVMTYIGITAASCVVLAAIITIVILLTKQSCPFIYANTGSGYDFTGEIFSGSVYPSLERHDYLALPTLAEINGAYSIRITNEVREIQHTNLMELQVVDHPAASTVLMDLAGTPHTISDPQTALRSVAADGTDLRSVLCSPDSITYLTNVLQNKQVMDSVILTFKRPASATQAKLWIRAKNSFWLDYVYGQFLDLFGNKLEKWNASRAKSPREEIESWSRDQGLPLAVYMDDGTGYKPVAYLPEAGPMAFRDFVVPVSFETHASDSIRIKCAYGAMFWELDYAAIDYSTDLPVTASTVAATHAEDETGKDVLALITGDDNNYYIQPDIGNRATVTFPAPMKQEGYNRTVFLHSKGYYQILRQPKQTAPDVAYLQKFTKPGAFIQFANEHLQSAYHEVVK
jgi:hypothetical protein